MAPTTYRQSQTNPSAPIEEDLWGPEFDEYSTQKFEPEFRDMPGSEVKWFLEEYQALPLQYLESQLCRTDPRSGTLDELAGIPIVDSINRLWQYISQSGYQGVALKHYYGFICLRHMLFTTSSAILHATGAIYQTIQSLHPDASWSDWARTVAFRAIDITAGAMADPGSFGHFCKLFTREPFISDASDNDTKVNLCVTTLYDSRDRFFTLCSRGLVPGCALLLLALLNLLEEYSARNHLRAQMIFLQDLSFRLYLVGSNLDRQILHHVCISASQGGVNWSDENKRFKSLEDTRTIVKTYSNLFLVSQHMVDISTIPIHFMGHLAGFVLHTAVWTPQMTTEDVINAAQIAVHFLWLLLERRDRLPITDHSKVRFYAGNLFGFFGFLQRKSILTRADQQKLAKMFAQVEIVALMGRVLLLVLENGKEFQNTELLDWTIQEMSKLVEPINKSAKVAPELFLDSMIEWAKVYVQLGSFIERKGLKLREEHAQYVLDMMETWGRYTGVKRDYFELPPKCIYPRCSQLFLTESNHIVRNICGRCKVAIYCNTTCQYGV
ncbi:hypothetical protein FRC09_015198 [Ceratobasidium sp. 395]|nr:hypothetical protein FRC09_015198 [Ceratobasidium sp. 395]